MAPAPAERIPLDQGRVLTQLIRVPRFAASLTLGAHVPVTPMPALDARVVAVLPRLAALLSLGVVGPVLARIRLGATTAPLWRVSHV